MASREERDQRIEAAVNAEEDVAGRPAAPPDAVDVAAGFETSDIRVGSIVRALVGLAILSAIAFGIVSGFQALLTGRLDDFAPPETGVEDPPVSEVPDVIESRAATGTEFRMLRESTAERLGSYGWIDEEAGITHIPIQRAMELLVERGLPTRPESETEGLMDNGMELPLDSSSGWRMERIEH